MPEAAPLPPLELGLVVPGRPVSTEFVQTDETKLVAMVPAPGQISEMSVFLLPGSALPPGAGLAIYWSVEPFTEWQTLGTISADKPSAIFHPGWKANDSMQREPVVQIGVSMETDDFVGNLSTAVDNVDEKLGFARLVAGDLFRFMASFAQSTPSGEALVVPTDVLDRWMHRFDEKFRKDPTFLHRTST